MKCIYTYNGIGTIYDYNQKSVLFQYGVFTHPSMDT